MPQGFVAGSGNAKLKGSLETPDQAAVRDAVQQKLEGSAAVPATRRRQSKCSAQAGESPGQQPATSQRKRQPAVAGQAASGVEHDLEEAGPSAPLTPEYQHKTRQGRTRRKVSA